MRFPALLISWMLLSFSTAAQAVTIQEVTSPGGIKAWLVEEHALPLVSTKILFKEAGYAHDLPGKEGRANMTAGMLTEGAGELSGRAFTEALEGKAIRLQLAADTDTMQISLSSLSEHNAQAFYYLGLVLNQPRFDPDAIERMRRQSLAVLAQQEQNPGYLLMRRWQQLAYGTHPYARPQIGFVSSVEELQKEDLLTYTKAYLTKENMIVAVVGDITPQALGALLDQHLGNLPASFKPDSIVPDITVTPKTEVEEIAFDIPQTMIMFGAQAIKRDDPSYITAHVMNEIIGGNGLNSLLGDELREKRGLTYGAGTVLIPQLHNGSWRGQFSTRSEKTQESLQVLRDTLARFAAVGPTDKELTDAKRFLTGSFMLHLDSNNDLADFLANLQLHQLPRDYIDKRNALIEAVSKDDIKALATRFLQPGSLLIATIGKRAPQPPTQP
ncbi:MAG: pitrilysin family protein [Rickettsiales bacterium]|nr:pitrilysin family protein [Rickettsiales bacterium]